MIIGITGTLGAGKGTIVSILKEKGFKHYSASEDVITPEIVKRNLPINRDSMVIVANDLRKKSHTYVAEKLYEMAQNSGVKNCVIESLRTIGEINVLKNKDEFYLFSIDANPKLRYERILKRKSSKDNISFDKFIADEALEMQNEDENKQNISKCIKFSDFNFQNNGTIEQLKKEVEGVLNEIGFKT